MTPPHRLDPNRDDRSDVPPWPHRLPRTLLPAHQLPDPTTQVSGGVGSGSWWTARRAVASSERRGQAEPACAVTRSNRVSILSPGWCSTVSSPQDTPTDRGQRVFSRKTACWSARTSSTNSTPTPSIIHVDQEAPHRKCASWSARTNSVNSACTPSPPRPMFPVSFARAPVQCVSVSDKG